MSQRAKTVKHPVKIREVLMLFIDVQCNAELLKVGRWEEVAQE